MKLSLPNFASLRSRLVIPLGAVLNISWWLILVIFLGLLFADGLVFYQYGLGRVSPPAISGEVEAFRVEEETIRAAAEAIEERRSRFEAAQPVAADLANPFR